jgi:hypothetical protein
MLYTQDIVTTCSGKIYLPEYFQHVPDERFLEFLENFKKSKIVDLNPLMAMMTITTKLDKTLREYGVHHLSMLSKLL